VLSDLFPALVSSSSPQTASERGITKQFLRFYLEPDTAMMLPVAQLTGVLTIPVSQIVPIPDLPNWVMGVYNWRGEVLWMVDFGHLVGLTPWYEQALNPSTYRALVLAGERPAGSRQVSREMLGLVVSRIEGMEWCNPDEIQSPPSSSISPSLVPFLQGYWLEENADMIATLDGEAILAAMPKP
jgi:positive phototaxis protein PixI